jgi:hypothetical protein
MMFSFSNQLHRRNLVSTLLTLAGLATSVVVNAACIEPDSAGTAGLPQAGCSRAQ